MPYMLNNKLKDLQPYDPIAGNYSIRLDANEVAQLIDNIESGEKLTKQQKKFQDQATELQKYEEKVHHLADQNIEIDLDDGVKHNYELFADVLAKIK